MLPEPLIRAHGALLTLLSIHKTLWIRGTGSGSCTHLQTRTWDSECRRPQPLPPQCHAPQTFLTHMATPRPPQLDAGSKWASPAASIRSLSALLEVGRDVSRAGGATSRAPDAAGEPQDRSTDVAHPAAATCAARFCALQDDRRSPLASAFSNRPPSRSAAAVAAVAAAGQPTRGAEQQQQLQQSMLAAKESEAALLRQQQQQSR